MEPLTLEQAAIKYDTDNFSYPTPGSNVIMPETTARKWNINAFTAGAEWQKEQYKLLFTLAERAAQELELLGPVDLAAKINKTLAELSQD